MAYELDIFSSLDRKPFVAAVRPAFAGVKDDEAIDVVGYPEVHGLDDLDRDLLGAVAGRFLTKLNFRGPGLAGALLERHPLLLQVFRSLVEALPDAVVLDDYTDQPLPLATWVALETGAPPDRR